MITNIVTTLRGAAAITKRASDRVAMREAADQITRHRHEAAETADNHRAWVKQAEGSAARRGYEAGYADGFARGIAVALDPIEPDHAAAVRVWTDRRTASAPLPDLQPKAPNDLRSPRPNPEMHHLRRSPSLSVPDDRG